MGFCSSASSWLCSHTRDEPDILFSKRRDLALDKTNHRSAWMLSLYPALSELSRHKRPFGLEGENVPITPGGTPTVACFFVCLQGVCPL